MQKKLKTPTLFHFKGHNTFAFSDTHGRHRQITVPQQTDILICAGDAVEDNLDPADYQDFLAWYKKQPAKLRLFIPGNHELSFDIAPLWAETRFKTEDIVLLHNGIFSFHGINFASVTEDIINALGMLPKNIDILVTHYPPLGILDESFGSNFIRQAVEVMKPHYHIFWHIHKAGMKTIETDSTKYINVSHNNILNK